ncbi:MULTISPECIES: VTT domain-containing protein [unclassified Clostridium]|uniref:TVP38/TMEM64 family membrane protein n=1 Tax=Clostridium sulfidigenes TaxID=318464 RepID=A0A927W6L7_9CLOT|nr:TVP38/TMEM64 family protein [Clostridium sulfidigenes]
MEKKLTHKNRNLGKILILIIIVSLGLAYFFIPTFNSKVNGIFMLFSSMSIESVAGYIRSFGIYAVLVSFLLMVFQSVAAPLPAFLITFANAAIFGWWKGALLSWISSMTGAALCFYIGRILGRDAVEKLTSKYAMASVDGFFEKYGKHTILVCRLLPFVSFDFISYAAGLTSMGFLEFIVATGIGQLPATVVYSYIGGMLTGGAQMIVTALLILFAITVLVFMFKQIYNERQKKSKK